MTNSPPPNSLALSIVIATRDRADQLGKTLDQLAAMSCEGLTWEIVVVDNGSRDGTPQILRDRLDKMPLVALTEPEPGKNRALNRALDVVRGKLLAFIDDDIMTQSDWARQIVEAAARWPNDDIFGGPIEPVWPERTPAWIRDPDFQFASMAFGRYALPDGEGPVSKRPHGGNLIFRSTIFDAVRYDATIGPCGKSYVTGSESELLRRLAKDGKRYIYLPSIPVGHVIRADQVNMRWLFSRVFKFGRSHARFQQREDVPHLFRVPRYQLRRLLMLALRLAGNCFRSSRTVFDVGTPLFQLAGYLHEYRRLDKQHDQSPQDHLLPPNHGF